MDGKEKLKLGLFILLITAIITVTIYLGTRKKEERPTLRSPEIEGEALGISKVGINISQGRVAYKLKIDNMPEYAGKSIKIDHNDITGDKSIGKDYDVSIYDNPQRGNFYNANATIEGDNLDLGRFVFEQQEANDSETAIFADISCEYGELTQTIRCKQFETAETRYDKYINIYGMSNGGSVIWEFTTDEKPEVTYKDYANNDAVLSVNSLSFGYWADSEAFSGGYEATKDKYIDIECTKKENGIYNIRFSRAVDEIHISLKNKDNTEGTGYIVSNDVKEINYSLTENRVEIVEGTQDTVISVM